MIASKLISKLFERRQFSAQERMDMRELYQHTEMLAHRMATTVPNCPHLEEAIFKLKDSLAACETAVALNPKFDTQMGLPLSGDAINADAKVSHADISRRIQDVTERAHKDIANLAAHARI